MNQNTKNEKVEGYRRPEMVSVGKVEELTGGGGGGSGSDKYYYYYTSDERIDIEVKGL